MLKKTLILALTAAITLVLYFLLRPQTPRRIPSIQQIQFLSQLVTLRVKVADVVDTSLDGYTGGINAAIVVRGDYLLGTDLAEGRVVSVDSQSRKATLLLQMPKVISPRVDLQRSRIVLHEHGLWQLVPGPGPDARVLARLNLEAQRLISASAADEVVIAQAKEKAEQVLTAWFEEMSWRVEIRWVEP